MTIEMKRAGVVMVVMAARSGLIPSKVLAVTNRRFGGYSLPGGKCVGQEDPRWAALRELGEETSLVVEHKDLVRFGSWVNDVAGAELCEVTVFYARAVRGKPRNVEVGTEHAWLAWDELLRRSKFRDFYARHFPDGISHLRETMFSNT